MPFGCLICSENKVNESLQCQDGYYLYGIYCLKCNDSSCSRSDANNPSKCTSCSQQYNLIDGKCSKCLACNQSSPNQCLSCYSLSVLSSKTCNKACPQYCLRCDQNNNNIYLQCKYGYGSTLQGLKHALEVIPVFLQAVLWGIELFKIVL